MHRTRTKTDQRLYSVKARWPAVTWLLIAGFLLQPILSYLATPVLAHTATGVTVVVCTLHGPLSVTLDLPGQQQAQDAEYCSALQLMSALATTRPADPLPVMAVAGHQSVETRPIVPVPLYAGLISPYSTRAPPVL